MTKIGFIGCGNMGGALASAVAKAEDVAIYLADYNKEKAYEKSQQIGAFLSENAEIADSCDYIFLGVKPQMLRSVLEGIAPVLAKRNDGFTLVSMAAGVTTDSVCDMAGGEYPVIRIMPNTPVAVGEGMVLYCAKNTDAESREMFLDFMSGAGEIDALPEKLIDAASAVSGCGPAFVYMFIEALADGGVKCGLPRDKAIKYAAQTVLGSGKYLSLSKAHPGELKDAVCSPGGSTIAGVAALEDAAFRSGVISAVEKAYRRTAELGKQ